MRLAHRRVQTYFEDVEKLSDSTSKGSGGSAGGTGKTQSSLTPKNPLQTCQAGSLPDPHTDMWLLDMCYRVAVVRHVQMREECTRQLGRLFARAKEVEMKRRTSIAKAAGRSE